MTAPRPLSPYRVLEIGTGAGAHCGRLLADLGAEVIKVEPPGGDPMRQQAPLAGDTGLSFLWYNANKSGATLDLDDPSAQRQVFAALADFDVLVDANPAGWLAARGLDPEHLRDAYPELIVTSVSDFGQWGPYRDWKGSSLVHWALAGSLIRCGLPTGAPVGPPYQMSYALAGITAASATALALWERNRTGKGDWLDCSILEAIQAQADWSVPIYSTTGMTAKRAGAGPLYRLYPAGDGYVRVINLSARQWKAFTSWLGDPPELAGPEWMNPLYRGANFHVLESICEAKFSGRPRQDLFRDGQSQGVGIVPIYSPADVMEDEHFRERGTFVSFPLPDGRPARSIGAFMRFADARPESPRPAPKLGDRTDLAGRRSAPAARGGGDYPLSGYRVIEVGSGAVAPEITRILGEYGADVIKLESRQQVDFMRLQGPDIESSVGWSSSNRNKRSVLLDLKNPEGNRIGRALAAKADIIVENNTGGVMDRLGLGYSELSVANPKLVYLSSQAFGSTGPASSYGGFGPSNQALSGVSYLWNEPDAPAPEGVQVIFPDIILGRAGALAIIAALDETERTGQGQHIDMGQAELAMACIGEAFIESDLLGESAPARGNHLPIGAPWGVFPSLAEDSWIAITVESDDQWRALKSVVNNPGWDDPSFDTVAGRLENRDFIEAELSAFTSQSTAVALMRRLQSAGVPAGAAYDTAQVLADVHLAQRGWPVTVTHPVIGTARMEGVPFKAQNLQLHESVRAPLFGEHTGAVLGEWLGAGEQELAQLKEAGALS